MKRWQWHLHRLFSQIGLAGLAGVVLLVSAMALYFATVQPGIKEIARMKAQLGRLHGSPQTSRQYAPAEELALFYNFFPGRGILAEQVRTVQKLAAKNELLFERIDYKLAPVTGTPLWRYQMSFPLTTDYATLRHYVADVLQALPNSALENVDMQRSDVKAEVLDAKINLVLYFRESP